MFQKIGLIPLPAVRPAWMHTHAFLPNVFALDNHTLRIVAAFRDAANIGRIGYIDVRADDPLKTVGFSEKPGLDIGTPGAFDDNGVSPLSIVFHEGKLRLYYCGWQLSDKVRYFLFTGLAESTDFGVSYTRFKKTPILERTDMEMTVRAAGLVQREGDHWKMYYSGGSEMVDAAGKSTPTYDMLSMRSADGIHWPDHGTSIFAPDLARKEFGYGRPFVMQQNGIWRMWYGYRHLEKGYIMGYAESADGEHWVRQDEAMGTFNSDNWPHDAEMRAYPSFSTTPSGTYMFYNGNGYGKEGICVAKLLR